MQKYQYYTIKKDIKIYRYYSLKNILCLYELQRKQSDPHSLLIKFERSICLTNFLKGLRVLAFLVPRGRRRHSVGPRYLIECFPYFTVLKRGMTNSEFLRLYWVICRLKISDMYVRQMPCLTLNMRVAMLRSL